MVAITKHWKDGRYLRQHRWQDYDGRDVFFGPIPFLDGDEDKLEVLMELEGDKMNTVKEEWVTVWEMRK